ncbi:MAG: CopG family transcriptional regulator [Acidimicrobiales bacterium]
MRTTLDIDEDVLFAVKERARRERSTAGQVLSELARRALNGPSTSGVGEQVTSFRGFTPFAHRGRVVSNALIDQLRAEESV